MLSTDPLDAHIPTDHRINSSRNSVDVRGSSRSFFQALNTIAHSDRHLQSSSDEILRARPPPRRHHSYNLTTDVNTDIVACKSILQRLMSDDTIGEEVEPVSRLAVTESPTTKGSVSKLESSFTSRSCASDEKAERSDLKNVSSIRSNGLKKGASFHGESEHKKKVSVRFQFTTPDTDSIPHNNAQVAPAPKPDQFRRPIYKRPVEKPLIEDLNTNETESFSEDTVDEVEPGSTMQVTAYLWTLRGIQGSYSGQVNTWIQPHGFGSLVMVDGTTVTCKWCNGMPINKIPASDWRRHSDGGANSQEEERKNSIRQNSKLNASAPANDSGATYKRTASEPTRQTRKHHYNLGDAPHSMKHMVIPTSSKRAFQNASMLNVHDFAFVLRSNGEWCYAIVAKKTIPSGKKHNRKSDQILEDAHLLFVTDTKGSTKLIKMKHWGNMVRLTNDL